MTNPWHQPNSRKQAKKQKNRRGNTIVLDSGTNITIARPECTLTNTEVLFNGELNITSASKNTIRPTSKGDLPLQGTIVTPAVTADVNESLLAPGELARKGYVSILDDSGAKITKKEDVHIEYLKPAAITGTFDDDNLWRIPLQGTQEGPHKKQTNSRTNARCNSAYAQKNNRDLVEFLHGCAGFPVKATWIDAIKAGRYASWPGLTHNLVNKSLKPKIPTIMGHMTNIRGGVRSTKLNSPHHTEPPRPHLDRHMGHQVMATAFATSDLKGLISTDLAGRFPFQSFKGNNYVFLLYDYDSNAILVYPIKSRKAADILVGYERCYQRLVDAGITPVLQRLDNEISTVLINSIKKKRLKYQVVTANDHRTNPAERAMRTFKEHFTAILNGTDKGFPAGLWDELLEQTEITLNLLRQSRINPKLSSYAQVFGTFDFNTTPLAPLGIRGILYVDKDNRPTTFSDHGLIGWYVGPCMHKYRNYRLWTDSTHTVREHNSIALLPGKIGIPNQTETDRLSAAIENLVYELRPPTNPTHDLDTTHGTKINKLIQNLRNLFHPEHSKRDASTQKTMPSPRVSQQDTNKSKTANLDGARQRFEVGTIIYKEYDDPVTGKPRVYTGRVSSYTKPFYKITYEEDGDQEDMIHAEVARHARRQTYGAYRHTFTRGYSRAVNSIQFQHTHNVSNGDPWNSALYEQVLKVNAVTHHKTGKQMEYRQLIRDPYYREAWLRSCADELGNLFQGARNADGTMRVEGTNTCFWIPKGKVPEGRTVTYARIVCDYRPQKVDRPRRTRITAGGNLIYDYPNNVSTNTAGLETIKLHWNSVISTLGAKYMCMDIGNMYLNTHLDRYEYMRFNLRDLPPETIEQYDLNTLADDNGWCYCEIRKAIYGLKQSGALAAEQLKTVLEPAGYFQSKYTPGLWLHKTRRISFTLVVDDFGVKYENIADANHLLNTITAEYPVKTDWTGEKYIGIDLKWDYTKREVTTYMKGYVKKALHQFQHDTPHKPEWAPSKYEPPKYGQKIQYAPIEDPKKMTKTEILYLQQICGKFLYYARAVDDTMLHALNDLASQQSKGTSETMKAMLHFLNYAASLPNAEKIYKASDMILTIDSDAAYLVAPQARSRAGGFHYLGNKDGTLFNGSIAVIARIIKNVMASAAEAEVGALYLNAQAAVPLRTTLNELGHPQPATPIKTDNSTADGILNGTIKQQRSKAIDMRFYWLKDRAEQGQFKIYWAPGEENWADYFTKHHSATHHKTLRPVYLKEPDSPSDLQGCVKLLSSLLKKRSPDNNPIPNTGAALSNGIHAYRNSTCRNSHN